MERFIATQTKTNESLSESINLLTSRLDAMTTHRKTMDTQITQIGQQVSHLSRPLGHLPGQPETNPRCHVNVISTMREGLEESPAMVLQEVVLIPDSAGIEWKKKEENLSSVGDPSHTPPAHTYQPPVPFPHRQAWSKLSQLEPIFTRFLDTLRQIYVSSPFMKALKDASAHLKFLRELMSKKGEPGEVSVAPIGGSYSALLQRRSPSKLQDPENFSIPCCIGDMQIERTLCDLGSSVSLMPLSLCKKLQLRDLTPTSMTI